MAVETYISIITLNVSGLNAPNKRDLLNGYKKKTHLYAVYKKPTSDLKTHIDTYVSFKICVSLLIFCFEDLSIGVSGVLKSSTIIMVLSIYPFLFVSVCLMYWGAPMLDGYLQLAHWKCEDGKIYSMQMGSKRKLE